VRSILPEGNAKRELYVAKSMMKPLGLRYQKIDICPNFGCCITLKMLRWPSAGHVGIPFINLELSGERLLSYMLGFRYVRSILLKRYQHLSRTISSLNWEKESIVFQGMTMVVKWLRVRTCQYSPILDDSYKKNCQGNIFFWNRI